MRKLTTIAAAAAIVLLVTTEARAQFGRGGPTWTTASADAQRTASLRTDPQINRANVQKGVVEMLWKLKLNNTNQQMNSVTAPVITQRIISYRGFKDPIFLSGSNDMLLSVDEPLGKVFWETKMPYQVTYPQVKGGTLACPGGLTSQMSLPTPLSNNPPPGAARGAAQATPPLTIPARGIFTMPTAVVYGLSSDGLLHSLNQHTGLDLVPVVKLVRPNANAKGLAVINNVGYVATADECGSAFNGVYALDLTAQIKALSVVSWL